MPSIVFFFKLGWLPGPIGRIDLMVSKPDDITGLYTVDSLLTGNWEAFGSAAGQLVLPVAVLTFVYMPLVLKNTQSAMQEMLGSEFVTYARAAGLPRIVQWRYALLNALPPMITVTGILTWFLLGGAVLVETVFAWGGLGQYAVQSVVNSDYARAAGRRAAVSSLHHGGLPAGRPRLLRDRPEDQVSRHRTNPAPRSRCRS